MKRIIINADDFGRNEAINSGVIDGFLNGVISNATIMTTGSAFLEAACLSKKYDLPTGLHLDLSNFFNIEHGVGRVIDYKTKTIPMNEIEEEISSQIKIFMDAGLKFEHIDSHYHIHLRDEILPIVVKVASKYGVKTMRFIPDFYFSQGIDVYDVATMLLENNNIKRIDRFVNGWDFDLLENIIDEDITLELMAHPAKVLESDDAWRYNELKNACDNKTLDFFKNNGYEIISYRDIS